MAAPSVEAATPSSLQRISGIAESCWMRLGNLAKSMNEWERALLSYEYAVSHNPFNVQGLAEAAAIYRAREQFDRAIEHYRQALQADKTNGELWTALGHCLLMIDDLEGAYHAYRQALAHLPNPRDPSLWYGIGILYDRFGSYEHAEEAFSYVLQLDPRFDKAAEVRFRLGMLAKHRFRYDRALEYFRSVAADGSAPRPLADAEVWFQIGHVLELMKDLAGARDAYEHMLRLSQGNGHMQPGSGAHTSGGANGGPNASSNGNGKAPGHARVLQQLGWLHHQLGDHEAAITYLRRALDADAHDAQTWYLLGRCHMVLREYNQAYDCYRQAVLREEGNPSVWCSLGVLFYQMGQFRDALEAYSRAIHINPYLPEVWYNLGTLYERCQQIPDAVHAYRRAAELDPQNAHIQTRLAMLQMPQQGQPQPYPQQLQPPMHSMSTPGSASSMNMPPLQPPGQVPPSQQPQQPGTGGRRHTPPGVPMPLPMPMQMSMQQNAPMQMPMQMPMPMPMSMSMGQQHPQHGYGPSNPSASSTMHPQQMPLPLPLPPQHPQQQQQQQQQQQHPPSQQPQSQPPQYMSYPPSHSRAQSHTGLPSQQQSQNQTLASLQSAQQSNGPLPRPSGLFAGLPTAEVSGPQSASGQSGHVEQLPSLHHSQQQLQGSSGASSLPQSLSNSSSAGKPSAVPIVRPTVHNPKAAGAVAAPTPVHPPPAQPQGQPSGAQPVSQAQDSQAAASTVMSLSDFRPLPKTSFMPNGSKSSHGDSEKDREGSSLTRTLSSVSSGAPTATQPKVRKVRDADE